MEYGWEPVAFTGGVLVLLVPVLLPVPLMVLGLFLSGIQALIFATLASTYIAEALEDQKTRRRSRNRLRFWWYREQNLVW